MKTEFTYREVVTISKITISERPDIFKTYPSTDGWKVICCSQDAIRFCRDIEKPNPVKLLQ